MPGGFTAENVVNTALRQIGYPIAIGSIYEGSPASKAALDVYAETVWALLRTQDQEFSRKVSALVATGNPAPLGWTSEYAYPPDCLRVRTLAPPGGTSNNPLPVRWDVGTNVISAIQTTVIWTNLSSGSLVYTTSAVTEFDWNAGFLETVVQGLATKLMRLVPSKEGGGTSEKNQIELSMQLNADRDS